jgi:hypothetical protein
MPKSIATEAPAVPTIGTSGTTLKDVARLAAIIL